MKKKRCTMTTCPYCGTEVITVRTASRQRCDLCYYWFLVTEEDNIRTAPAFMCRKCGANKTDCSCNNVDDDIKEVWASFRSTHKLHQCMGCQFLDKEKTFSPQIRDRIFVWCKFGENGSSTVAHAQTIRTECPTKILVEHHPRVILTERPETQNS
jgi:hypothetical protein